MSDYCGNNVTYAATSVKLEVEDEVESGLLSEVNDVKDEDDVRQDVDAADVKSELNNHVKDMIQVEEEQETDVKVENVSDAEEMQETSRNT